MSSNHHVTVNVEVTEDVKLDEVLGQVPRQELLAVLNSEWARQEGWRSDSTGCIFGRPLSGNTLMELQFGADGGVRLLRRSQTTALDSDVASSKAGLEVELAQVHEQYSLAFNDVLARAYAEALPRLVREQGYEIVEQRIKEDAHLCTAEVKVYVYELSA